MNEAVTLDQTPDLEKLIDEARSNYIANNPNSKQLYEAAKDVMPGANTRTVLHYEPFPPVLPVCPRYLQPKSRMIFSIGATTFGPP
ncbi:MAG: hypothetical protein GY875_18470 [Gammaproteobacteria bacterium]|nr:hypothetical protein [Gammaproteobacteria bacterium]